MLVDGHVGALAQNRLDLIFDASLIKIDQAVGNAIVGDGKSRHSLLLGGLNQLLDLGEGL